ncbi:ABC transporter substrate-binding protein [Synechococcus sp. PCC 6312]|uniref:ABC transporter substrate-binding protein n=1 Tax=Synechococcus sp. (strain ATCC 27167 / PCC 6312) TaxID=195253 RepID=UPI00029EF0BD|nr:ABC transporter substrate-binding protein [Synechococcus sp. PCC 6312]AFY61775.1 ABC-type dipeptide transport system, periplasmic component [Synechococcus sp. PCC 6312]
MQSLLRKSWSWRWLLGLFILALAWGCQNVGLFLGTSEKLQSHSQQIVIGTTSRIRTLDPADAYEVLAGNLLTNLGDRLYAYGTDGVTLEPQLATQMPEISPDGRIYRIPLRQGVRFHDGTPFNAAAMVFSLQRFMDNGGQPAGLLAGRVTKIQATGEYELEIHLKEPFIAFPELLAFSGLCAVSPQTYRIGKGEFNPTTFVGTGPYRLVSYRSDALRLAPFEDYWGTPPRNPGVDIQIFSSSANLFNAFRTGNVDLATPPLDPNQVRVLLQEKDQWQVLQGPGNVISLLSINLRQPPWNQLGARQALAASINRQRFQERVFLDQALPLYSMIPTIFPASKPVFEQLYGNGTPASAEQWLKQAGFSVANPLVVNLWYRANIPSNVLAATVFKASLERDIGAAVQVELDSTESATIYRNLDTGAYPLVMLDWYGDFYDPDNYVEPFLSCEEGNLEQGCKVGASAAWGSFFYSPKANELINQSRKEADPNRRRQIFQALQELTAEQVPFIPLWQNETYLFVRNTVQGAQLNQTQQFLFSPLTQRTLPAALPSSQ